MLNPEELANNRLFKALVELRDVDRPGILTIDVTSTFDQKLSGSSYSDVVEWVNQLGVDYPADPIPNIGAQQGIGLDYSVLRKVPQNEFRAYDRIAITFVMSKGQSIQVIKAAWVNTAAFP